MSFALVDGDHSTEGVRKDIDNLLRFRPTIPFYIVMHDSLLPSCRDGLKQANWTANPHIHAVELDFVPGIVNPARSSATNSAAEWRWDLTPARRQGRFEITARSELTLQAVMASLSATIAAEACGPQSETDTVGSVISRLRSAAPICLLLPHRAHRALSGST